MQNNLRTKTLKPLVKVAKPNKYVLETDKSRDTGHAPCVKGHVTYFLNFWTLPSDHNFSTDDARDFVFSLLDRRVLHNGR